MALGVRVVFMDRPLCNLEADAILIDNVGGARMATHHLLGHGHRRIGAVGDPPIIHTIADDRLAQKIVLPTELVARGSGEIRP